MTHPISIVMPLLIDCAGGFSAAVTTPLDFAKTRIMLADVRNWLYVIVRKFIISIEIFF